MLRIVCASAALLVCAAAWGEKRMDMKAIEAELVELHGEAQRERVKRGLDQVGKLWRAEDGDLAAFAREHFLSDQKKLDETFARFERSFEALEGHQLAAMLVLREPVDLDMGPLLPVDPLLGAFDPTAHLTEDMFTSKLAFVALLNFPLTTLEQRLTARGSWSRRQWAEARLTKRFARRIPATVQQEMTRVASDAELYISEYNIWMHHLLDENGERLFPSGLRLITHWNLRDELRGAYADPQKGLARQRMIAKVMERIVTQTIPAAAIDNPRVDWNPYTNEVKAAPASSIEADAPARPVKAEPTPEANVRYDKLLALHRAFKKADPHSPTAPTAIARTFEDAEVPEARTVELLTQVLASPLIGRVAGELEKRLGRKLEPQDIWYNGFKGGGRDERELDAMTRKRYPTPDAFAADIPRILVKLGFSQKQAKFISERMVVDPSRGAGHAWGAGRRGEKAHLRTRVEKDGMNYKGYNIAVHELGHNAEQVISLHLVDHWLLNGVPITAITEALAFVFQARDLELLGLPKPGAEVVRQKALGDLWATFEIAGVALVEIRAWHWMYKNPGATAAQLRDATVAIAREVWNQYYAPVLGGKDSVLLGIYSHMLSTPLYLFNYPLGHIIAFQIEEHMAKNPGKLGAEFERMCRTGLVTPDEWMRAATGSPIDTGPLLRAAEAALR